MRSGILLHKKSLAGKIKESSVVRRKNQNTVHIISSSS
jgi:hypothetical protein